MRGIHLGLRGRPPESGELASIRRVVHLGEFDALLVGQFDAERPGQPVGLQQYLVALVGDHRRAAERIGSQIPDFAVDLP